MKNIWPWGSNVWLEPEPLDTDKQDRIATGIKAIAARLGVEPVKEDNPYPDIGLYTGGNDPVNYDMFELINALLDKVERLESKGLTHGD